MEHEMYIMQVKKPEESKYPWDYYKLVQTMSGEQAFGKLSELGLPTRCASGYALSDMRALFRQGALLAGGHVNASAFSGINRFTRRWKMR